MNAKVSLLLCLATVVIARPNLLPGGGHNGHAHGSAQPHAHGSQSHAHGAQSHAHVSAQTHAHEGAQSHAHGRAQAHAHGSAPASAHSSHGAISNGYDYSEPPTEAPTPSSLYETPTVAPPPPTLYQAPVQRHEEEEAAVPFSFQYIVKDDESGVDFSHNTNSDGNVESGSYSVLLPDTRIMTVTYTVDAVNGYQADVSFEGEAQYPDPHTRQHQTPDIPDGLYSAPRHQ